VIDPGGAGTDAAVKLFPVGSTEAIATTRSQQDGHFEFRDLTPGAYAIRASLSGFFQRERALVSVRPGEVADAGTIKLGFLNCDFVICDSVVPTKSDILSKSDVFLPRGCSVDLDTSEADCADNPPKQFDLTLKLDNSALFLLPIHGATIGACGTREQSSEPLRIDGLGAGNNWCVRTTSHHVAHIKIELVELIGPGLKELPLVNVLHK